MLTSVVKWTEKETGDSSEEEDRERRGAVVSSIFARIASLLLTSYSSLKSQKSATCRSAWGSHGGEYQGYGVLECDAM